MNCTRKHAKRRKDEETNRAHVVSQDVPPVHKNLCQKGYVWVTMVIERALFLLIAAVWVIKTHFFASRCSLGHFSAFSRLGVLLWPVFFAFCPNYSINTPNQTKHPVCWSPVSKAWPFFCRRTRLCFSRIYRGCGSAASLAREWWRTAMGSRCPVIFCCCFLAKGVRCASW